MLAMLGIRPDSTLLDQTILSLFQLDFLGSLRLIRSMGPTLFWFITHLVDLLHFHDPNFIASQNIELSQERPFSNGAENGDVATPNLRARLLFDYSNLLFSTDQMWEIAPDYLLASNMPNALEVLNERIGTLDWGGCIIKVNRLLTLCQRYGLEFAKQDILRAVTYKYAYRKFAFNSNCFTRFLRSGDWSDALGWALRTDSLELQSHVARQILLNVSSEQIGQMRIFDALAEEFLTSPELVLLFKFYTFKHQLFRGKLNRAITLLHELFMDSCSPIEL